MENDLLQVKDRFAMLLQEYYHPVRRDLPHRRLRRYTSTYVEEKRFREIYRYNFEKNSLEFVCKMIHERSSHSICYLNNCIYLIGGFSKKDGDVSRDCEVFRLDTHSCEAIAPLNAPSANSCATPYHDSYIFKFGGVLNKNEGNSLIEMYSVKANKWATVNIETSRTSPKI